MQETLQGFRLSHQQQRVWSVGGPDPAFCARCNLLLAGELDPVRLQEALARVIGGHEIFRTAFRGLSVMKVPIQVIEEGKFRPAWRRVDLRDLGSEERETRLRELWGTLVKEPFNLERAPLLRAVLARLGARRHALLLAVPALCADERTLGNLMREIARAYQGIGNEAPVPDPEERLQYVQFSDWQHEVLQESEDERRAFWEERVLRTLVPSKLPQERRPAEPSARGIRAVAAPLDPRALADVDAVARSLDSSPELFLLLCYKLLLWRFIRQDAVTVAAVTSGRWFDELAETCGPLARALPVTTLLAEDSSFRSVLKELESAWAETVQQQDYSEPGAAGPPHDPFAFGFEWLARPAPVEAGGVRFTCLEQQVCGDRPALKLRCTVDEASVGEPSLSAEIQYDAGRFSEDDVVRFAAHFRALVAGAARAPQSAIAALPLVDARQRDEFLQGFRGPALATAPGETFLRLFERQTRRTPERIALRFESEVLSFAELDRRSDRLARFLSRHGVGAETPVPLCLERSAEMVVSLLGVLKAGGAYVPLVPDQPKKRLASMLGQLQAPVLITQERLIAGLPACGARPMAIDSDWFEIDREEPGGPPLSVEPGNLAYLIFTSGSTGQPKGVMVEHRQLLNYSLAILQRLAPPDASGFALVSTFAADLGHTMLFPALATGGCLHVISQERASDPPALADYFERHPIDFLKIAPSHFEALYGDSRPRQAFPRRCVVLGGEASRPAAVEKIQHAAPGLTIFNHYGPTEATVGVLTFRVGEVLADERCRTLPIGRPLANNRVLLLDPRLEPVPAWAAGELFLGGGNLTRGYFGRPSRTASSFVPDPSSEGPGARLYRTGDLARHLPSADVEFLGRVDNQIKFHGFRVELDEIRNALDRDPRIRESVVLPARDPLGQDLLVAYYVSRRELPAAELRALLLESIPEEILPTAFVHLSKLPYTRNGKVDLEALPSVEEIRSRSLGTGGVAPRTGGEAALARIWAEILSLERVGVEDSFFELGGHSLLATRLIGAVQQCLAVAVPLRRFLDQPTVAGMAVAIAQIKAGEQEGGAVMPDEMAIVPQPEKRYEPFPLNEVQQAYWIGRLGAFELGNVATHTYFEFERERLDFERFQNALRRLIARHDMLRAVVLPEGEQRVLPEVPPYDMPLLDLRGRPPEEVEAALVSLREEMAEEVFDPESWPLFDFRVTRLDGGKDRIHICRDALIFDAWSATILFKEWARLYRVPATELPPREVTFRDYVLAERAFKESAAYRTSWDYWQRRLATLPPAPELPLAKDPTAVERPRFVRRTSGLEPELWQRLKRRAATAGLTPSGLIVAAFAEVLGVWSKCSRFTLNLTLFHRLPLHPEVHDVLGDFTSMTLLAVEPPPGCSFELRARRLQEQLWEDMEHRQVSGVRVLRELARSQHRAPGALIPVVLTSLLALESSDHDRRELLGQMVYSAAVTSQVWLDHAVVEDEGGLVFNWNAVEALFPPGMLDDVFDSYCRFLHRLVENEEVWGEPPRGLVPPEQLAVRAAINAAGEVPVSGALLHTLVWGQVPHRLEQPAVIAPDRTLSYGELQQRSLRLSRGLSERGVGPGQLVAVVMEKGWEQVVAVLGILDTGAAYLPIDASLPRERIWHLLERGEVAWAVTQPWLEKRLSWPTEVRRWIVETAEELVPGRLAPGPAVQGSGDVAYVIFTSGSTGEPKGVMIDHGGAVNTILDVNRRFDLGSGDRVLALSALSFDLSVWDIFGLLAAGGAVVLPEVPAGRDPGRWLELIAEHRVTVWNTVPALMEMLVEHVTADAGAEHRRDLTPLRLVLLSGDWIPVRLPDRIRQLGEGIEVISLGGATEASIWSIWFPVAEVDPAWTSIPYGKPLTNQRFHVLDSELEPTPVWVAGQLFIGGAGVARGYWRDEDKTAASFLDHPRTGERLYATGDLGRYLPDGNIEFLGRDDLQVKIQGYRIELGEIEAAAAAHPSVQSAVVVARGERSKQRLVAYVVPEAVSPTDAEPANRRSGALLTDPSARAAFKLRQPGVRRFEAERSSLPLPAPARDKARPRDYRERRSYRTYSSESVALNDFGRMLACLSRLRIDGLPVPKYRYPSAGHLYPVQTYLYVKPNRLDGASAGTYYYDPDQHRLVRIAATEIDRDLFAANNHPVFDQAAGALFLVAPMDAVNSVYGARAREFCLLEAGYLSQLLMLEGPNSHLGFCPLGTVDAEALGPALELEPGGQVLHTLLWGALAAEGQTESLGAGREAEAELEPDPRFLPSASAESTASPAVEPTVRLRLKLEQPGLRKWPAERPAIGLDRSEPEDERLATFERRRSHRRFRDETVTDEDLGWLIGCLRQIEVAGEPLPRYGYPSAGHLYPVQVYLYVQPERVEGVAAGTYYYQPQSHGLVQLSAEARLGPEVVTPNNREMFRRCALALFLVADLDAIEPIYGSLARDFCFLEAGYMCQLLMTESPAVRVGLCPVGTVPFEALAVPLTLNAGRHLVLHTLLAGRIAAARERLDAWLRDPMAEMATPAAEPREPAAGEPVAAAAWSTADLREELPHYLSEKLPRYMVPGAVVLLEELPLTANGKVDRGALPAPEAAGPAPSRQVAEPRNDLERAIATAWREVLAREKVGVGESFFDLGGNSIDMVQVHGKLRQALDREIRITELFEYPTIEALAAFLAGREGASESGLQEARALAAKQKAALERQRRLMRERTKPRV